jgi:hypothetical protein
MTFGQMAGIGAKRSIWLRFWRGKQGEKFSHPDCRAYIRFPSERKNPARRAAQRGYEENCIYASEVISSGTMLSSRPLT